MKGPDFDRDYQQQNPWWESGNVSDSDRYHTNRRSDYQYKLDSIRDNRFVSIAGAAGSGKTTILHQIAHDLISDAGLPPRNVMYLPLGDPRFQIGSNIIIDAIDEFATYYWKRGANESGYVFIDDAHATESWSNQVRACLSQYDGLNVAVTLPTLARAPTQPIDELDIETEGELLLPPKFYDSLTESSEIAIEKQGVRKVRDAIEKAADSGDVEPLRSAMNGMAESTEDVSHIKRSVMEYFGGRFRDTSIEEVRRNLELTIYRDVPRYQHFEDRSDLHALCAIAATYSGQTLGLKSLSEVLDCDRRTLQRYIDILEDFFILTPSYQYEHERRRSVRLYIRDPVLVAALTDAEISVNSEAESRLMTSVVFDHLKRLTFYYNRVNSPVRFWESGGEAVDFVIETPKGTPLPIVISNTSNRTPKKRIHAFCDEHECEFGISIARDAEPSVEDEIATFPRWMFLLFI